MLIASAPNSEWLLVAALVLLANLGVDLQAYTRSSETWKISIGTIVVPVVLFLFSNNLPRLVFGSLGVGYIFCEGGSVLVNKAAADKIWRVLPDAIDREDRQRGSSKVQPWSERTLERESLCTNRKHR
jgi:hypothetical protein